MKKLFKKISLVLICSIILLLIIIFLKKFNKYELNLKKDVKNNEKIMEYDVKTGTTKEVDMENLKNELRTKKEYSERNERMLKMKKYTKSSLRVERNNSAERVKNVKIAPYNRVCRIESINSKSEIKTGSASIVGKKLAITAAHCVWDSSTKQFMKDWRIYPGYEYSNEPVTSQSIPLGLDKVFYSNEWMNNTNPNDFTQDWAICVLESSVDGLIENFDVQTYQTNSDMKDISVTVLGYPRDIKYGFQDGGKDQYETGDKITKVGSAAFLYNGFCVEGFDGGPIICDSNNYIVGIHVAEEDTKIGLGVRITENMINIILNNQ